MAVFAGQDSWGSRSKVASLMSLKGESGCWQGLSVLFVVSHLQSQGRVPRAGGESHKVPGSLGSRPHTTSLPSSAGLPRSAQVPGEAK